MALSNGIRSKMTIKKLGFLLTSTLKRDMHVNVILNRTAHTIKLMNHLKRWLKFNDYLKVVTSKHFGIAYYGSPVWMTPGLSSIPWKRLASQHYRAMRVAIGEWKTTLPQSEIGLCVSI